HAMMVNLRKETWTWRPTPDVPSLPMRQYGSFNPGQGVGGAAVHWTAQLWRFAPDDFRVRSHLIERYGEAKLPEGNRIQDWPVSFDDLEPHYDAFEQDIGASGQAGNLRGDLIEGGNPFEGPRSNPYPNPPMAHNVPAEMFRDVTQEMGYHPFPYPSGIASRAFVDRFGNARAACIYCGFCTRYGCEVDAKSSPLTTHLPVALRTGRYDVRRRSRVLRVELDGSGHATGLTYVDEDGVEQFQPADIVVLSGFTLTNVRMMLLSRNDAHPDGIGNDRGLVGKNYTYQHFTGPWRGYFPGRRFHLYMGNGVVMNAIYDFYGDNFDHSDLDFVGGAQIFSSPGERDPETSAGNFPIGDDAKTWGQEWKDSLRDQWNSYLDINMEAESLPYEDQFLDLDPNYTASDGQPLLRLTFDWHDNDTNMWRFIAQRCTEILEAMGPEVAETPTDLDPYTIHAYQSTHPTGGAIMGTDPSNSVTNSFGQVWDTPNLFVTGAALFPQNPAANPTGTVAALAYRTGDAIVQRYLKDQRALLG
ncbi:MAG: GMC family oxidoreductase, partial [Dehalococcoidia bacterium]